MWSKPVNHRSLSGVSLRSDQQQSLIDNGDNALTLYNHIKEKYSETTKLTRMNKLRKKHLLNDNNINFDIPSVTSDIECKECNSEEDQEKSEETEQFEWNYLLICIKQLMKMNPNNVSYQLLAIQIFTSCTYDQELNRMNAIDACNQGIQLCIEHLHGHPALNLWITTFYVLKGQILFQQRHWKEVISTIAPSLKYNSENVHLLYNLRASAFCELKKFHNAISDYGFAIDRTKEPSSYYNSRGTCWHELKLFDKALKDYNKAVDCNKKCVSAYNNRASLFVDMKKYEFALNDANEGLSIFANHGNLYKHRALAYFHLKCYGHCLDDLQKSIQFVPQYRPARTALKMVWDFYRKHITVAISVNQKGYFFTIDMIRILTDFVVGDNYHTDDNMVDATYADWKREMEMIEEAKHNNNNNKTQTQTNTQTQNDTNDSKADT